MPVIFKSNVSFQSSRFSSEREWKCADFGAFQSPRHQLGILHASLFEDFWSIQWFRQKNGHQWVCDSLLRNASKVRRPVYLRWQRKSHRQNGRRLRSTQTLLASQYQPNLFPRRDFRLPTSTYSVAMGKLEGNESNVGKHA